jgi:hypothetical protein
MISDDDDDVDDKKMNKIQTDKHGNHNNKIQMIERDK